MSKQKTFSIVAEILRLLAALAAGIAGGAI